MQDIRRRVRDSGKTLTRGGGTIDCHAPHVAKAFNNTTVTGNEIGYTSRRILTVVSKAFLKADSTSGSF